MSAAGLGDLVRALDMLAPENAATREQIARALGFDVKVPGREAVRMPRRSVSEPPPSIPPSAPPVSPETEASPPSRIEPVSTARQKPLRLLLKGPSLEKPRATGRNQLAFEPLFRPQWTRNLISAAVATRISEGPVDLSRLVETAALGRPLRSIPRHPQPSLFRGVQVLVDLGEAMEPFARDQVHLLEEIRKVVGREATSVVPFRDNPLRGAGPGPFWQWGPYRPPSPGTPVFALTDMGIGGPAVYPDRSSEEEWLAFADLLKASLCPLVGLIPYTERRWPRRLRRGVILLCWDRSTTVGTVCQQIRHGHEVRL